VGIDLDHAQRIVRRHRSLHPEAPERIRLSAYRDRPCVFREIIRTMRALAAVAVIYPLKPAHHSPGGGYGGVIWGSEWKEVNTAPLDLRRRI
jgi:hypothetical protein